MQHIRVGRFAVVLALLFPWPAAARQQRASGVSCKEIRKAISANHTLDQIIQEFDTDAAHVMKCTQSRHKGHSSKPKAPAKAAAPKGGHKRASNSNAASHGAARSTP